MILVVTFVALYAAHMLGDHWLQRHEDALGKGKPGQAGRSHCLNHVIHLTALKGVFLVPALWATDLFGSVSGPGLVLILAADAASHYWADRAAFHPDKTRPVTLERLGNACGKAQFWALGKTAVDAEGRPAPSLGTGAYAMDQSFHITALFVAALILEVLS